MIHLKEKTNRSRSRLFFWTAVVVVLLVSAVIAPYFLPHDPYEINLKQVCGAPGNGYLMGTDDVGRCVFCRLVEGSARSIYAALLVTLLCFGIGTLIGIICGYCGGVIDTMIMRLVDTVQAFPSLVFTVAVAGMLGKGLVNCIIAMTVVGWVPYARMARSEVLTLKEKTFVHAAKISGMNPVQMLLKTILPNSLVPLVVLASMQVGNTILNFAGLSYLGLGTAPPYPEWGTMLNNGQGKLQLAPWCVFFPGLAILLVVMIMGMFGDSINESLTPGEDDE